MVEEQTVTTKIAEPIHLTTTRNAKGKIQYEISIHAATVQEVAAKTEELEMLVKAQHKGELAGEETA